MSWIEEERTSRSWLPSPRRPPQGRIEIVVSGFPPGPVDSLSWALGFASVAMCLLASHRGATPQPTFGIPDLEGYPGHPSAATVRHLDASLDSGESLTCTATYTVAAGDDSVRTVIRQTEGATARPPVEPLPSCSRPR